MGLVSGSKPKRKRQHSVGRHSWAIRVINRYHFVCSLYGKRTLQLTILLSFLWCPDIEQCFYWKVAIRSPLNACFMWFIVIQTFFTRFDLWFSSHCSCLCSVLNVSIKIYSVVIGSLLYLSIWPRQTDKIPSAALSHGNCGLLTTIAISVLLHTAWPFASWWLSWMITYTVSRWLHNFIQKQSKGTWKYSGKCLWALELYLRINS